MFFNKCHKNTHWNTVQGGILSWWVPTTDWARKGCVPNPKLGKSLIKSYVQNYVPAYWAKFISAHGGAVCSLCRNRYLLLLNRVRVKLVTYIHKPEPTRARIHTHSHSVYLVRKSLYLKKKNMSAEEINFCHTNHIKVVCFALLHISYIFHYDW